MSKPRGRVMAIPALAFCCRRTLYQMKLRTCGSYWMSRRNQIGSGYGGLGNEVRLRVVCKNRPRERPGKVGAGFRPDARQIKNLDRDDDSKRSHLALTREPRIEPSAH